MASGNNLTHSVPEVARGLHPNTASIHMTHQRRRERNSALRTDFYTFLFVAEVWNKLSKESSAGPVSHQAILELVKVQFRTRSKRDVARDPMRAEWRIARRSRFWINWRCDENRKGCLVATYWFIDKVKEAKLSWLVSALGEVSFSNQCKLPPLTVI